MRHHLTTTPTLWDRFDRPGRTRRGAPPTSRAAAVHNAVGRRSQAQRVYNFIRESGGATIEEVQIALGLRQSSAAARGTDLRKAGLIVDSGLRKQTTSGAHAAVWFAVSLDTAAEGAGE